MELDGLKEKCINTENSVKSLFDGVNELRRSVSWQRGAIAVFFVVFSLAVYMISSKVNYTLGRVDEMRERASEKSEEVLQRLSKVEAGVNNIKDLLEKARTRDYGIKKDVIEEIQNGKR